MSRMLPAAVINRMRRAAGLNPDVPGCDFCGTDVGQQWTRFGCGAFDRITAHPTPWTPGLKVQMRGGWDACRRCEPLVTTRAWRPLLDRYIRVAAGRRGYRDPADLEQMERAEIAALWMTFERHATGEKTTVARQEWEASR